MDAAGELAVWGFGLKLWLLMKDEGRTKESGCRQHPDLDRPANGTV